VSPFSSQVGLSWPSFFPPPPPPRATRRCFFFFSPLAAISGARHTVSPNGRFYWIPFPLLRSNSPPTGIRRQFDTFQLCQRLLLPDEYFAWPPPQPPFRSFWPFLVPPLERQESRVLVSGFFVESQNSACCFPFTMTISAQGFGVYMVCGGWLVLVGRSSILSLECFFPLFHRRALRVLLSSCVFLPSPVPT